MYTVIVTQKNLIRNNSKDLRTRMYYVASPESPENFVSNKRTGLCIFAEREISLHGPCSPVMTESV